VVAAMISARTGFILCVCALLALASVEGAKPKRKQVLLPRAARWSAAACPFFSIPSSLRATPPLQRASCVRANGDPDPLRYHAPGDAIALSFVPVHRSPCCCFFRICLPLSSCVCGPAFVSWPVAERACFSALCVRIGPWPVARVRVARAEGSEPPMSSIARLAPWRQGFCRLISVLLGCPQVSVTDEEVVKAKDFALAEIIKLSDSYRDMKITKVMSAETARSVSAPLALLLSLHFFQRKARIERAVVWREQAFADGTNYFLKMELECTSVCAAPLSPVFPPFSAEGKHA